MIENRAYLTNFSRDLAPLADEHLQYRFENAFYLVSQRANLPPKLRRKYALDPVTYVEGFTYTPTDFMPVATAWLTFGKEIIDPTRVLTGEIRTEYYPVLQLTGKQVDTLRQKAEKAEHELTLPLLADSFYQEHGPKAKTSRKALTQAYKEVQHSLEWWLMHLIYPPVEPERV